MAVAMEEFGAEGGGYSGAGEEVIAEAMAEEGAQVGGVGGEGLDLGGGGGAELAAEDGAAVPAVMDCQLAGQ